MPPPPPPPPQPWGHLRFISASSSRQHPQKQRTGIPNADVVEAVPGLLGLCDGVSGVYELGISPDVLPQELMASVRAKHEQWCSGGYGSSGIAALAATAAANDSSKAAAASAALAADQAAWLVGLAESAFDATQAQGATTLLLAALRDANCGDGGYGHLVTSNVGDCALLVLRPQPEPGSSRPWRLQKIFKTETGRYGSRRPVQVQRLEGCSKSLAHSVLQGAKVQTILVQPGDLVVMGSDGLFDNLTDEDIREAVDRHCAAGAAFLASLSPPMLQADKGAMYPPTSAMALAAAVAGGGARLQEVAKALVNLAIARALGQHGGNADDTTAIVAAVVQEPGGPSAPSNAVAIGAPALGSLVIPPLLGGAAAACGGQRVSGLNGTDAITARSGRRPLMDRTNSMYFDPDDPKEKLCLKAPPQRCRGGVDSFVEGYSPVKGGLGCIGMGETVDDMADSGCRMS